MARRVLIGGAVLIVVLALLGAWQIGLFTDEPEEANLADAIAGELGTEAEGEDGDDGDDEPAPATTDPPGTTVATTPPTTEPTGAPCTFEFTDPAGEADAVTSLADLDGVWNVRRSDSTFAGYRIDEILAGADFTAVGRTSTVSGTVEIADATVVETIIAVDMVGLTSDSRIRDEQLKSQALETRQFPLACFTLTQPIALAELPADGVELAVEALGELHIHGVTREALVPLQATTVEGLLFVVGSLDVALADFDIDTPTAPAVAGVSDIATFELSLVLSR